MKVTEEERIQTRLSVYSNEDLIRQLELRGYTVVRDTKANKKHPSKDKLVHK